MGDVAEGTTALEDKPLWDLVKDSWDEKNLWEQYGDSLQGKWEQALKGAIQAKLDYFKSLGETSPQKEGRQKKSESTDTHLKEFLAKLMLYAPEEWFKPLFGIEVPPELKNDFKVIGVAFDASSRLRRAGIESLHADLSNHMVQSNGLEGKCLYSTLKVDRAMSTAPTLTPYDKLHKLFRNFVRVVAVSDTHLLHEQLSVPEGDILVHAGDLSYEESRSHEVGLFEQHMPEGYAAGKPPNFSPEQKEAFFKWFREESNLAVAGALAWLQGMKKRGPDKKSFTEVILVGGNHDYFLGELGEEVAEELCKSYDIRYLHDKLQQPYEFKRDYQSLKFWGSAVSFQTGLSAERAVKSGNTAFQVGDDEAAVKKLEAYPVNQGSFSVDVLVTHTPPNCLHGKAGLAWTGLGQLIHRVDPRLYICGHCHQPSDYTKMLKNTWIWNPGDTEAGQEVTKKQVLGVNASTVGVWNQRWGLPVVVDMELETRAGSVSSACKRFSGLCNAM